MCKKRANNLKKISWSSCIIYFNSCIQVCLCFLFGWMPFSRHSDSVADDGAAEDDDDNDVGAAAAYVAGWR